MLATDKQIKFIGSIRQTFTDYDAVIGDKEPHPVPTPEETWEFTKAEAGQYISKNMEEFKRCWTTLLAAREQ